MIASGLQIYEAYARFGTRGGPYFVSPFDGAQFPHWSRLGGWLAGALNWHFALAWPLVAFGLVYLGYLVRSGEWRALLFRPRDVRGAIEMTKYYLHLFRSHPPQGKHNPLQKLAYTGVIGLGALAVLTGFAVQADAAGLADDVVRRISGGALLALLDRVDLRGVHDHARDTRVRRGSRLEIGR